MKRLTHTPSRVNRFAGERKQMMMKFKQLMAAGLAVLCLSAIAAAQTTAFTYQGKLSDAGSPANGQYQLQFKLYDAGGTQIGATHAKWRVISSGEV